MAGLSMRRVGKVFSNGFAAVKEFNIEVEDGEFIVLAGPSGCGKSTTLRMIAGLEDITSGGILIGGNRVNEMETKDRDVAMVFQNYALYPDMTVYENMAFGLRMRKLPEDEIDREVRWAARLLNLEPLLDSMPRTLTGGQRQNVAIGRAIARRPKVLLMDEPLSNLAEEIKVQNRRELKRIHKELKSTVIYVTQDQTEAMALGNRIVVMNDGEIRQIGTPEELYQNPCNKFVAGFIGSPQMNLFDVVVEQEGDCAALALGEHRITLPKEQSVPLLEDGYAGKTVVCGIRPEDFRFGKDCEGAAKDGCVEAMIQVQEAVGDELFLYFQVDKVGFVARCKEGETGHPGDRVLVCPDASRFYLFDPATERIITNQ